MPEMNPPSRVEELRRELNATVLMQQAREHAGLTDYGDLGFVKSLEVMLDCYARDADFHAAGLAKFKNDILRSLINRLRFQNDLNQHPEIPDEDVSDPVIILGLPRSGTTKLQRMMAADPGLLKTALWQLRNPARHPGAAPEQPDPRIAATFVDDILGESKQELLAAHHFMAEQTDEDWMLFEYTFNDWFQNIFTPSPSWNDWQQTRTEPSDADSYRYVKSLFQYLQWQQGGRQDRRWLMKNCGHIGHMDALLQAFPRATLVHIHRHPAACVPSFAKIVADLWRMKTNNVESAYTGNFILQWEQHYIDRYLDSRQRLNLDGRIFDVPYDQIRDDPLSVIREIYRRADRTLTAEAEQAMLKWNNENEQHRHGKHSYSLEEFGLSEAKIDEAFGDYILRLVNR
jgi:Sulfotransferase family